jgi:hypothetical protein
VFLLAKRQAALRTHKSPFSRVEAKVLNKFGALIKHLVAIGTVVGSFSRVDADMGPQVAVVGKRTGTGRALERLFTGVDAVVNGPALF